MRDKNGILKLKNIGINVEKTIKGRSMGILQEIFWTVLWFRPIAMMESHP